MAKVELTSLLQNLDLAKAQKESGVLNTLSSGGSWTDQSSQSAFVSAVENHIDEFKHGLGELHQDVDTSLAQKDSDTSALLARTDPKASELYNAYSTQLGYDKRARFVEGLSYVVQQNAKITGK